MRSQEHDILLVDDDIEDSMLLKDAFADQDYVDRITIYDSGFDFLQQFAKIRLFSPQPVLIILDYNLNGANADILLQQIKEDVFLKGVRLLFIPPFALPNCMTSAQTKALLIALKKAILTKKFQTLLQESAPTFGI